MLRKPATKIVSFRKLVQLADVLSETLEEYISERENPAPDFTMRRICYDRVVEAQKSYQEARK